MADESPQHKILSCGAFECLHPQTVPPVFILIMTNEGCGVFIKVGLQACWLKVMFQHTHTEVHTHTHTEVHTHTHTHRGKVIVVKLNPFPHH